jgi:hypothetical protein
MGSVKNINGVSNPNLTDQVVVNLDMLVIPEDKN